MATTKHKAPVTERDEPTTPARFVHAPQPVNPSSGAITVTPGYTQGKTDREGRSVLVQSILDDRKNTVILTCDGGNLRFQHNMTPNEARELAGYLQAEANCCEQYAAVSA